MQGRLRKRIGFEGAGMGNAVADAMRSALGATGSKRGSRQ
jgi:hypothetical protein